MVEFNSNTKLGLKSFEINTKRLDTGVKETCGISPSTSSGVEILIVSAAQRTNMNDNDFKSTPYRWPLAKLGENHILTRYSTSYFYNVSHSVTSSKNMSHSELIFVSVSSSINCC